MKKDMKSFLAKLLVLCMLLSMVPVIALAVDGETTDPAAPTDTPYPTDSPEPTPEPTPTPDDDYDDDDDDSSSSSTTTTPSTPTTDTGSGTTTSTTTASSTTKGTTASAEVSSTAMDNTVKSAVEEAAKQGTAPVVNVEVNVSSRATSLEVTLPAASLETLAAVEGASLMVSSRIAEVQLDHTALSALADKVGGSNVTLDVAPVAVEALNEAQQAVISEVATPVTVMDVSLVSDGEAIHDYDGGTITFSMPYTLPEGVSASKVAAFYLADNGAMSVCKTSYQGGKVTFRTNHLSTYLIGDSSLALSIFKDVDKDAYYADAVAWALVNAVTDGLEDNAFGPATTVTRGQAMTFLWRAAGEPAAKGAQDMFEDVPANEYYADAVAWAIENGITDGYSDTMFAPALAVSNVQMLTFLARAEGATTPGDDWQLTTAKWAVEQNLFEGLPAEPVYDEGCPRGDVVYFIYLVCAED